jgi:hypothetical protein
MKTLKNIGLLLFASIVLFSCTPNDEELKTTTSENVAPINGKYIPANEASAGITFRWTPIVPKPQSITYRLKVWQLMQGQNSTEAMRTNQPIVTKDVDNVTETVVQGIYTGPCKPPYLCDFVWAVQAIDQKGAVMCESNPTVFNF